MESDTPSEGWPVQPETEEKSSRTRVWAGRAGESVRVRARTLSAALKTLRAARELLRTAHCALRGRPATLRNAHRAAPAQRASRSTRAARSAQRLSQRLVIPSHSPPSPQPHNTAAIRGT